MRLRWFPTGVSHPTELHRVGHLRYQFRSILRWLHIVICTRPHRVGHLHCTWRIIHLHPCHMEVCPPTGLRRHCRSKNISLASSLMAVCHLTEFRLVNPLRCKCTRSGKTLPLPLHRRRTESPSVVQTPTLRSRLCIPRHEVTRHYHPCTHLSIAHTLLTRHHTIHPHHDRRLH